MLIRTAIVTSAITVSVGTASAEPLEDATLASVPEIVVKAEKPRIVLPSFESAEMVLQAGTSLKFVMVEDITSRDKQAKVGQAVQLALAEDVKINGVTVIPAGSPAKGTVRSVTYRGARGRSGYLAGTLVSMTVGGQDVPISGDFEDTGASGTAPALIAGFLFPFADMLVTDTSATIDAGTMVEGKLLVAVDFTQPTPRAKPVSIPLAQANPVLFAPTVVKAN